jgi:NTP pyrophosphatase (non-canonical NTP hydrolase)
MVGMNQTGLSALPELTELTGELEAISAAYAERFGIVRDGDWHLLKLHEEIGELTQAHLMREGQARPKGLTAEELDDAFAREVADVLCHVLLLAHHHGVDLGSAICDKWLVWRAG